MNLNDIVQALERAFPGSVTAKEEAFGQMCIQVGKKWLKDVIYHLARGENTGFRMLIDITAVDYIEPREKSRVLYFLHQPETLKRIKVSVEIERGGSLPSITELFEGADWYEREIFDLFGISFEGHPNLKRILMPDDWHGHPLRKDYALTEESVAFKGSVKPKVPSAIIPYVKN